MSKNYSNEFIFNFLQDKNYQAERGEQEYIMYFDMDMPRILNDFVNHVKEDMLKETEQRIENEFEIIHIAGWFVDGIDFEDDILPLIKGE